jgi:hypothetical protein
LYPAQFFGLFPPFPRDETVFVAMPFDEKFRTRWEKVIDKAIRSVSVNDTRLTPVRVDARVIGDSILTEILQGISRCRLVLGDISGIGELDGRTVGTRT